MLRNANLMKKIVFKEPHKVVLVDDKLSAEDLGRHGKVVVRNRYSIVSAGTELSVLSGHESWAPLPHDPGYGSVGRVVETDDSHTAEIGQHVLTFGNHAELTLANTLTVPIPPGLPLKRAVFARMAAVAITALRVSSIEVGDWVAVLGAGVVGNLTAQLCAIAGAEVIIVDRSRGRLGIAERTGIRNCLLPGPALAQSIRDLTAGDKCSTVIDATGDPRAVLDSLDIVGDHGEIVLLGTPRGTCSTDITPFLRRVHLSPTNLTVKGAHEWRYPVTRSAAAPQKHSIERNIQAVFRLLQEGRINTDNLLTRIAKPEEAAEVYRALSADRDRHVGVLFEWGHPGE